MLRRIEGEFAEGVSITYVMGGLAVSELVRRAGGEPAARPDILQALRRWGRMALAEVAEATGLALPRAA